MGLERGRWRFPFHPGRSLEQSHLPVQSAGRQAPVRPRRGKRVPLCSLPHSAARVVARAGPPHVSRLFAREACRRRGLSDHPQRLCVYPARVEGHRRRGRRQFSLLEEGKGQLLGGLRGRARAGVRVPSQERQTALSGTGLSPQCRSPVQVHTQAWRASTGWNSSFAAAVR